MKKALLYGAAVLVLLLLAGLVIWQGSFNMGKFGPTSTPEVYLFWAISTIVFLLMVTMGFLLFRILLRLYIDRSREKEGSHIKTKLVVGALLLSFLPVFFMVLWSYSVLNLNLKQWFSRPAEGIKFELVALTTSVRRETDLRGTAQANWLAHHEELRKLINNSPQVDFNVFTRFCHENDIAEAYLLSPNAGRLTLCGLDRRGRDASAQLLSYRAKSDANYTVVLQTMVPADLEATKRIIDQEVAEYNRLNVNRRETRQMYLTYLALITLFILFVATWIALFLARQITEPISALLEAARQVRSGNLAFRVQYGAIDELATLVRSFNEMTQTLEASSRELDARRKFTETILEAIPSGIISVSTDGRIQTVNGALTSILGPEAVKRASRLDDLFPREEAVELRYLMNRARRTGVASRSLDLPKDRRMLHLALTVAPIDRRATSGFVVVVEDTSELLRAQKSLAWQEVARRIAHEIKNPLTPIALSSERIARQLERTTTSAEFARVVRDSTRTISREVESVKALVDEFAQFARFPAAQPQPMELAEVVQEGLSVFDGRLENIQLHLDLGAGLPKVMLDREQFKRVVVNLIDNAAEAMQESPVRQLWIQLASPAPELVELLVADTGHGVAPEDKEKLFLPYFSTKGRGTGLGLAIVSHIVSEHRGTIRVEDNKPQGTRFILELPAAPLPAKETAAVEVAG